MNAERVDRLLGPVRVRPAAAKRARHNLEGWLSPGPLGLSPAKCLFNAGTHRGTPKPHNKALKRVETATTVLIEAINALRLLPDTHSSFWYSDHFGYVFENDVERPMVKAALEQILMSSVEAQRSGTKQKKQARYNLVLWATRFFNDFSSFPTKSPTNSALREFVQSIFEEVTTEVYENEELTRALRWALMVLPNESEQKND